MTRDEHKSTVRELAFWLNVLMLAAASFIGGRLADTSIRDPRAFVTMPRDGRRILGRGGVPVSGDNIRASGTGIYQHLSAEDLSRRNAQPEPQYDPRSGAHLWIAIATFRIADPDAQGGNLDTENLLSIHLGCYFCEEQYAPRLRHRRCPGELKD